MCGIAGLIDTKRRTPADKLSAQAENMAQAIWRRGPDDHGVWVDEESGVALGHRRLSILDLTPMGRQPMVSASGRHVIVYNGEIYNFAGLCAALEKNGGRVAWRGHSDTEILLEALERMGVERTLNMANGMFAFALWDRKDKTLTLARDRLGKKPLYYGWAGGFFLFASELKALRRHRAFTGEVDRRAVGYLLRHNYIPSPYSIYQGVFKLAPGCVARLPLDEIRQAAQSSPAPVRQESFWSAARIIEQGAASQIDCGEEEASRRLEELLSDAVWVRMISDVPVGAFLSGGIDSATVVSLMQAQSGEPVRTYSIGYYDDPNSEAHLARAVAAHLGTKHTELYVTPEQVMEVIPMLPELSDEPIGDTALIPTYIVSKLARADVTVALTGDGGDELFAGYPRYLWAWWYCETWLKRVGWIPNTARKLVAGIIKTAGLENSGSRLGELAKILPDREPEQIYRDLNFHWPRPGEAVKGWVEGETVYSEKREWNPLPDCVQRMVYYDLASRLPDSLLAKVDRVTMGVSLEARCPLLDHRVVEFSARIGTSMKIRDGLGKQVLRRVLRRHVPGELVDRPKKGFSMPISVWLRGGLRDWAEALLDEKRLKEEGIFDPRPIREKWEEHLSGARNWHFHLWDALMFQAWLEGSAKRAEVSHGD